LFEAIGHQIVLAVAPRAQRECAIPPSNLTTLRAVHFAHAAITRQIGADWRQLGRFGLEEFLEVKSLQLKMK
jgi:hypothetical protein